MVKRAPVPGGVEPLRYRNERKKAVGRIDVNAIPSAFREDLPVEQQPVDGSARDRL